MHLGTFPSLSLSFLAVDIISIVDQHYQTTSIDYLPMYSLACIVDSIIASEFESPPYQMDHINQNPYQAKINNHRQKPTKPTSPRRSGKSSTVRIEVEYPLIPYSDLSPGEISPAATRHSYWVPSRTAQRREHHTRNLHLASTEKTDSRLPCHWSSYSVI